MTAVGVAIRQRRRRWRRPPPELVALLCIYGLLLSCIGVDVLLALKGFYFALVPALGLSAWSAIVHWEYHQASKAVERGQPIPAGIFVGRYALRLIGVLTVCLLASVVVLITA
jgi:peptidoglycan/LPS O-acetylase OafA/YrhL